MTDRERYLFDLQGFLVIDDVLRRQELETLNEELDEYDLWREPGYEDGFFDIWRNGDRQISAGPLHQFSAPFRQLIGHRRILPYLADLLGSQFRYDHGHAMLMREGGGPFELHGGGVPRQPGIRYEVVDGQIRSELLVVEYALCDVDEGDGGLCVLPGSHKSNFACPSSFVSFEETGPWLKPVPQKAGAAVIFTEALTHGTLPWTADHERRALFCRYTPGHMAFVGRYREDGREEPDGGYPRTSPSGEDDWSLEARRMLEAPYLWNRADTIQRQES
tara:strand:- start:4137 stop:4964 length:828 start_codon:yes stop_codon:yes gene_type:complete